MKRWLNSRHKEFSLKMLCIPQETYNDDFNYLKRIIIWLMKLNQLIA